MAIKTILIGMGSFGHDVCDIIARRLESEHGNLKRISWLRMMVYETEQNTTSFLAQRGLVRHMGIPPSTWSSYLSNPSKFGPSIGLQDWADESVLSMMKAGGEPLKGANNVRPTGRLCFLDQTNHAQFHADFTKHYTDLVGLSEADAAKHLGLTDDEDRIRFGAVGANGDHVVKVILLGSLAGGTNSGSFIDVAYYLNSLPGIGDRIETTGLFVIPHQAYEGPTHWGNVFAALTELNHFSSGKSYQAKFANRPTATLQETAPFKRVYLVQSPSGSRNPEDSLGPLRHAVSELIHLGSIVDPEENVENTLVNPLGDFAGERDFDGRPMPYASIGASVILFPVSHILDGLSARLGKESLDQILQRKTPSESEVSAFAARFAVDAESYNARMVSHPVVNDYLVGLGQATQAAATAALKGDVAARDTISVRIKNGMANAEQSRTQNFQGEFRNPIHEVSSTLASDRVTQLDSEISRMAASEAHGLHWALNVLRGLIAKSEARIKELEAPSTDIGIRVDAQSSMERAQAAERRFREKPGCNPFARKPDQKALSLQWVKAMEDHWKSSFLIKSEEFEKETLSQLIQRAQTLVSRLSDPSNGLIQFAEAIRSSLAETERTRDSYGPIVNGLSLFVPGRTLQEEWTRYLRNADATAAARREVLSKRLPWFEDLTKPHGLSVYDRPKKSDWRDCEDVQRDSVFPFVKVRDESVETRLVAWPNWMAEVQRVASLGRAFISVDPARNPFGIPPAADNMRRPACIYFHDPEAQGRTDAANVAAALGATHIPLSAAPDRHRILFTEGLAVFAPYAIDGVEASEAYYEDRRRTRSDIAWQKLSGKPLDDQERYQIGLIFVANAFGIVQQRPDGNLLFATRATPFDPARDFLLCRNRDIADASYTLGRDALAARDLRAQVEKKILDTGLDESAITISRFNATVSERGIRVGNLPINNREAFSRELEFLGTLPGLIGAILGRYPDFDWNQGNWVLQPADDAKPAAYRCNRCRQFLAPEVGARVPTDLPEVCPNPLCGQRIRYDGIEAMHPAK